MADENIVTKWDLDGSGAQAGFERVADAAENAGKRVQRGMSAAQVAGNLATAAIEKLGGAMKKAARQALEWSEDMPADMTQVNALSRAVGGLVDKLTLAQTVEKMQLENMRLSQREMEVVSKAAVKLSRVWNVDFASAMETVTQKLAGGKGLTKLLNQLGLEGQKIAGLKDPTGAALAIMAKGLGDMSVKAENAKEEVIQLKNQVSSAFGEMGKAVAESEPFKGMLRELRNMFESLGGMIKLATGQIKSFSREGLAAADLVMAPLANLPDWMLRNLPGDPLAALQKYKKYRPVISEQLERGYGKGWEFGPSMEELTGGAGRGDITGGGKKGGGAGKKKKHGYEKGIDYFPGQDVPEKWKKSLTAEGMQEEFESKWKWEEKEIERATQLALAYKEIQREVFGGKDAEIRAIDKQTEAYQRQASQIREMETAMKDMATGAIADFASGLWGAADAAIMSGESFGKAALEMLKSTMYSIAEQATVKAIFYTAEGLASLAGFNAYSASQYFAAAGMFAGIAASAGAVGLGMSFGGVGREEKKEKRTKESTETYKPSIGQRVADDQRPIYIAVYIDRDDPAADMMAGHQISAALRRAGLPTTRARVAA